MATAPRSSDLDEPISSPQALTAYFRAASKPRAQFRVGLEQEKLAVRADGSVVAYEGPRGIAALIEKLEGRGFAPEESEDGHVFALVRQGERITLEPGGQLELSGPALVSAE